MAYDHILTPDLHHLAMSTRNGGLMEELRARTCENRWNPDAKDCQCWACRRYGLDSYFDFQLHRDSYPGLNGRCFCWVCEMSDPLSMYRQGTSQWPF